jgi:hypothetical protein
MTNLIVVYHSDLIITNEFVGMNATFLSNEFSTLENLIGLVIEQLSWMDDGFDIGSSNDPQIKAISPVCNEKEWTTHIRVMMKSDIREDRVDYKNG